MKKALLVIVLIALPSCAYQVSSDGSKSFTVTGSDVVSVIDAYSRK